MDKIKLAVIGAGDRGKDRYGAYGLVYPDQVKFVGVAEPNPLRRQAFQAQHQIKDEHAFESYEDLFQGALDLDGVIVATQDDMHFHPCKMALEKGYHVLLEKPMSNRLDEVISLGLLAKSYKQVFMVCHVLRYTPFYGQIKDIIESGKIGQVMSIQHNENIGYYHMAHSFVRGHWNHDQRSSPIILAKSCHDMDLLLWLVGKRCTHIHSYGALSHFKKANQPPQASDRCLTCQVEATCPYSAKQLYYKHIGSWPSTVITENQSPEGITAALETGPYGRCVYTCDNNVCDHQVTAMTFENGVTATFNLSAFTEKTHRTIKIMGTHGEIRGDDGINTLEIRCFGKKDPELIKPKLVKGGHGGGDTGIMEDFLKMIRQDHGQGLTKAEASVESHVMAFAAETSRTTKTAIDMAAFYEVHTRKIKDL